MLDRTDASDRRSSRTRGRAARCCLKRAACARRRLGDRTGSATCSKPQKRSHGNADHSTSYRVRQPGRATSWLRRLAAADDAFKTADHWADRFGRPTTSTGSPSNRPTRPTTQATGTTAQRALARIDTSSRSTDSAVRGTRGRMRLARGITEAALDDAASDHRTTQPRSATTSYLLRRSRAATRCATPPQGTQRRPLDACERFLDPWQAAGGIPSRAIELCEIAPMLADRRPSHRDPDAAQLLPEAMPLARRTPRSSPTSVTPTPPPSTSRSAANHSPPTPTCSPPAKPPTKDAPPTRIGTPRRCSRSPSGRARRSTSAAPRRSSKPAPSQPSAERGRSTPPPPNSRTAYSGRSHTVGLRVESTLAEALHGAR